MRSIWKYERVKEYEATDGTAIEGILISVYYWGEQFIPNSFELPRLWEAVEAEDRIRTDNHKPSHIIRRYISGAVYGNYYGPNITRYHAYGGTGIGFSDKGIWANNFTNKKTSYWEALFRRFMMDPAGDFYIDKF